MNNNRKPRVITKGDDVIRNDTIVDIEDNIRNMIGKEPVGSILGYIAKRYNSFDLSTAEYHALITFAGKLMSETPSFKVNGCIDLRDPAILQNWMSAREEATEKLFTTRRVLTEHLNR
jgi:hypothetical protein